MTPTRTRKSLADKGVPTTGTPPQLTWTHPIDKHMFCPADGVATGTDCVHPIDLAGLRQRAQDCIDAFGEGHWAKDATTLGSTHCGSPPRRARRMRW